jgi:heme a synthase
MPEICVVAVLHLFNVIRLFKRGPVVISVVFVAAAIIVQAALGIWTLLSVAALPLALLHQTIAMIVLTFAVVHAANATPQKFEAVRSQLSSV